MGPHASHICSRGAPTHVRRSSACVCYSACNMRPRKMRGGGEDCTFLAAACHGDCATQPANRPAAAVKPRTGHCVATCHSKIKKEMQTHSATPEAQHIHKRFEPPPAHTGRTHGPQGMNCKRKSPLLLDTRFHAGSRQNSHRQSVPALIRFGHTA